MIPLWAVATGLGVGGFLLARRLQPPGQRAGVGDTILVPISVIGLAPVDAQGNNVQLIVQSTTPTTLNAIPSAIVRADGSLVSIPPTVAVPIQRTAVVGLA